MSLARVFSRAVSGIQAPLVTIETHLSGGLPSLSIVGLPETAVKEARERVRSAILTSGFAFPSSRITINLAPADLPKEGGRFDLGIAVSILAASGQLTNERLDAYEFSGELALDGTLRRVSGILPIALQTRTAGKILVAAAENQPEASLADGLELVTPAHLLDLCAHLNGTKLLPSRSEPRLPATTADPVADFSEVRGQPHAKRALEIAAAGGHNLLMIGPPGGGKTMLANRLPGILPAMTRQEATECASLHSISPSGFHPENWATRPFRAPHHTASGAAIVGGGASPKPGEISLAHHGILFLDELPEFDRQVLEVLREPLESGEVHISRASRSVTFPARFQLIAAMNPCPCGYRGDDSGRCNCSEDQVRKYRNRISGPLLDRIDMHIELPAVPFETLSRTAPDHGESSREIRARVEQARARQQQRGSVINSQMNNRQVEAWCTLGAQQRNLMAKAMDRLQLSARAYHRILRVARTIADLQQRDDIDAEHLMEAIQYRLLDRKSA